MISFSVVPVNLVLSHSLSIDIIQFVVLYLFVLFLSDLGMWNKHEMNERPVSEIESCFFPLHTMENVYWKVCATISNTRNKIDT